MKKLTKKELFGLLLDVEGVKGNKTLENFISHELELLSKKSGGSGKLTPSQKENLKIKDLILELLADKKQYTATEVAKSLGLSSNQKASALLKQLVDEGKVTRIPDKKVTYFVIKEEVA